MTYEERLVAVDSAANPKEGDAQETANPESPARRAPVWGTTHTTATTQKEARERSNLRHRAAASTALRRAGGQSDTTGSLHLRLGRAGLTELDAHRWYGPGKAKAANPAFTSEAWSLDPR